MTRELLDFYVDFFNTIGSKDIKTGDQFNIVLDYFDWEWNKSYFKLKIVDVPDELKDKFKELSQYLRLYSGGYKSNGYAPDWVARDLYDYNSSIREEYEDDDDEDEDNNDEIEEFDDSGELYWLEPDCDEYEPTEFNDPVLFDQLKKIFELSDQDIQDIQKELDNFENPIKLIEN